MRQQYEPPVRIHQQYETVATHTTVVAAYYNSVAGPITIVQQQIPGGLTGDIESLNDCIMSNDCTTSIGNTPELPAEEVPNDCNISTADAC